jgi:hypothetical protein
MNEMELLARMRVNAPSAVTPRAEHLYRSAREGTYPGRVRLSARRPVRLAAAAVAVTAAAVAAIVVPAMAPGGSGDALVVKAWAVGRLTDGRVTVSVSQLFNDPAGLQRALRAAGVPAYVTALPLKAAGNMYYSPCSYSSADFASPTVQTAVVSGNPASPSAQPSPGASAANSAGARKMPGYQGKLSWIIRPAAMPRGTALLIASWTAPGARASVVMSPEVLQHDRLPSCRPTAPSTTRPR